MLNIIRTIAMSATVLVLAFTPVKTSARGCGDDQERVSCQTPAAAASPVQLDQFMKTWKPVSASESSKRTRSVSRSHRSRSHSQVASRRKGASESKIAEAKASDTKASVQEATPAPQTIAAAAPSPALETDGVAVTSFSEVNELDQAAPRIQVVAFNEVNEIDLAAPPPPLPAAAETVGQAISNAPAPTDNSWIGKLLLAAAGTIALAGGVRLLVV